MPYAQFKNKLDAAVPPLQIGLIDKYLSIQKNIDDLQGWELQTLIDTALTANTKEGIALFLKYDALHEKYPTEGLKTLFLADPNYFASFPMSKPLPEHVVNKLKVELKKDPDTFLDNINNLCRVTIVKENGGDSDYRVSLEEVLQALVEKHQLTVKIEKDFGNRRCYEKIEEDFFFKDAFDFIFKKDSRFLDDFMHRYKSGHHYQANAFLFKKPELLNPKQFEILLSHDQSNLFLKKIFNRFGYSMIAKWPDELLNKLNDKLFSLPEAEESEKSFKVDCLQFLLKWVGNFRDDDNKWYLVHVDTILSKIATLTPADQLSNTIKPHFDTYFRRHPLLIKAFLKAQDTWLADLNKETVEAKSPLYWKIKGLLDNADLDGIKGLRQFKSVQSFLSQNNLLVLLKSRSDEELAILMNDDAIQQLISGFDIQDAGLLPHQMNVVLSIRALRKKFHDSKEERLVDAIFDPKWDKMGYGFFGRKTPTNIAAMREVLGGKRPDSYPLATGLYDKLVGMADEASKQSSCLWNTREKAVQDFYSRIGDDKEEKALHFTA